MFDLGGKNALVTGASGGLGGAIARSLHEQGARVVLSGTKAEALNSVQVELGEGSFVVPANLSDPAVPATLIKESEEKKKVYLIVEEKFDGYIIDRISGSLDIAKSYIEERNKVTFATFVIIPINTNGILFHNERGGDVTDTIKNVFNHRFFGSELVI